jgi:UDP-arabinose 4-epimerase
VVDLAQAHLKALDYLARGGPSISVNVGSGRPFSVREILVLIDRVTGHAVPHRFEDRRPGDPPVLHADPTRAREVLGFTPKLSDLRTIIATAAPGFGLQVRAAA